MVSRVEGVQHKKGAKIARSKFQRCCKNCCCSSHCRLADHEAIGVLVSPQQVEFPGIEDMSYSYETSEFEEEISHIKGRPSHVSVLSTQTLLEVAMHWSTQVYMIWCLATIDNCSRLYRFMATRVLP